LLKPEKLLTFNGQKRWIFLPGIGSPGKVGINGIQEVVGSTPIGFHGVSDPNEERISRIVTIFVTEPPSVVNSVLPETALSRTSPHSMSTHPLWLALTE
jgi:hypothetical protein